MSLYTSIAKSKAAISNAPRSKSPVLSKSPTLVRSQNLSASKLTKTINP